MALDLRFQQLAGEVNSAFDGTERLLQHICYFMVFIAIKIQQKRIAKNFRQLMDRFLNVFHAQTAFSGVDHRVLVVVQQKLIRRTVEDRVLLHLTTIVVDEDVAHDGVQPRFNIGTYIVFVFVRQRPVQGFLKQVLGSFAVAGKRNGKGLQEVRIALQHFVEIRR